MAFSPCLAQERANDLLAQLVTRAPQGARAYEREIARHGWHTHHAPDIAARRFWTIALGIALEGHATGRDAAAMSEAMREALGELAEARSAEPVAAPSLHLVTASGRPSKEAT